MIFFLTADGYVSPRTAVDAGLMSENDAPWSGGLAFKALASGGYEYTRGRDYFGVGRKRTDVDLAALCAQIGGCELKHPGERDVSRKRKMPGEQAGHLDHHQPS
ncbi:hypothetical protein [Burkholderia savannae]|uniref:hypothetical protein n=1 Tax=Burkholderia savannae TaxID=1637837 RepID=UPI000AFFABD1|nr:hypothetical protein [Burkholderia savannae]